MITRDISDDPRRRTVMALTDALHVSAGKPTLLLLAGGSALGVLDQIDPAVLTPELSIMMMDERFSDHSAVNNFLQLQQTTFFQRAASAGVNLLPTVPTAGEVLTNFRTRIDRQLVEACSIASTVIALFGIGPDGHTAGIFPMEYDEFIAIYEQPDQLVAAVTAAPNQYRERVSITPEFMRTHINQTFVYAVGSDKQVVLAKLDDDLPINLLPAHLHSQLGSTLFTDQLYTT